MACKKYISCLNISHSVRRTDGRGDLANAGLTKSRFRDKIPLSWIIFQTDGGVITFAGQAVWKLRRRDGWLLLATTLELYLCMYPVRHNNRTRWRKTGLSGLGGSGIAPTWFVWFLAVVLLVSAGAAYRVLASRLERLTSGIALPVPLDNYPKRIRQWVGEDVPIPVNVQEAAGNDAFVNRLYRSRSGNEWVNVYIAYTAHPRTMRGHRPRICYPAGGWIHDRTESAEFTSNLGRTLPCLVHRFHRPAPDHDETVVLNFYIVNGRVTCDDSVFSGVGWRTPNIEGDPARYVTQVQISSVLENSTRAAAADMADLIFEFFPDEDGRVKAAENDQPAKGPPQ